MSDGKRGAITNHDAGVEGIRGGMGEDTRVRSHVSGGVDVHVPIATSAVVARRGCSVKGGNPNTAVCPAICVVGRRATIGCDTTICRRPGAGAVSSA